MSGKWEEFLQNIKTEGSAFIKVELKDLIESSVSDSEAYIREQTEKLDRYLSQLASDAITKSQFERLVRDLNRQTEMEALRMDVATKARAQRLVNGISDLVLKRLLDMLV